MYRSPAIVPISGLPNSKDRMPYLWWNPSIMVFFGDAEKSHCFLFHFWNMWKKWVVRCCKTTFCLIKLFLAKMRQLIWSLLTIYSDLIYPGFPQALVDNPPAFEGLQSWCGSKLPEWVRTFYSIKLQSPKGTKSLETKLLKARKYQCIIVYNSTARGRWAYCYVASFPALRIFPIHRKQYILEAVRHFHAQGKMLCYCRCSTRSILGTVQEEYTWNTSTLLISENVKCRILHPSTQTLFFPTQPRVSEYFPSAGFSQTMIRGDSKAKFILGHGARKLHPLGQLMYCCGGSSEHGIGAGVKFLKWNLIRDDMVGGLDQSHHCPRLPQCPFPKSQSSRL